MRRVLYFMHLYAGLFFGAAVVFVGVTGSAVMYRPEIEQLLNPEWFRASAPGEMRPLDELVANAVQTVPRSGADLRFDPTATWRRGSGHGHHEGSCRRGERALDQSARRSLYGSGARFLRPAADSFRPFRLDLHSSLHVLEHTWGEQIVGVFGIVLLLFCVTGAVLWWPGTRSVIRALKVRWRGGAFTVNYDLHRVAGIALLVPLTLVALTGIVLVFPRYTRAPIVAALDIERPPKAPRSSGVGPRISVEAVRNIVARAYPAARLAGIQLPGNDKAPYHARLLLPGDSKKRYGGGAKLSVWIDAVSGEVLKAHDATSMPVASRVMFEWIFPDHGATSLVNRAVC